ncbi:MAG: serine aminopeptidase domain-containing protein [Thiohalomonadales bacterium]
MKLISITTVLLISTLIACGGGGSGGAAGPGSTQSVSLQCDLTVKYIPRSPDLFSAATTVPPAIATAILVHGKKGSPAANQMLGMQANLNAKGYDVIMPYMTWSGQNWDGTLCDSISYLNELITTEKNAGKKVILLGHSLGGPSVLAYNSLKNTTKPDAVVVVAPGHYIHYSNKLASAHAPYIQQAKTMIANGQADQIANFMSLNGGQLVLITSTPVTYLSMHDINQFPDIKVSTAAVSIPLLWLAGDMDNLTTTSLKFGLPSAIPNSSTNLYKVVPGTHLSVMSNDSTSIEINNWFSSLK